MLVIAAISVVACHETHLYIFGYLLIVLYFVCRWANPWEHNGQQEETIEDSKNHYKEIHSEEVETENLSRSEGKNEDAEEFDRDEADEDLGAHFIHCVHYPYLFGGTIFLYKALCDVECKLYRKA